MSDTDDNSWNLCCKRTGFISVAVVSLFTIGYIFYHYNLD